MRTIMTKLSELRQSRELRQDDLARLAGIDTSTVYRIESGKIQPNFHTIVKLAEALEVSPTRYFELVYETWCDTQS